MAGKFFTDFVEACDSLLVEIRSDVLSQSLHSLYWKKRTLQLALRSWANVSAKVSAPSIRHSSSLSEAVDSSMLL
jgi:hypothetical protein